jgi:hypothetical protein
MLKHLGKFADQSCCCCILRPLPAAAAAARSATLPSFLLHCWPQHISHPAQNQRLHVAASATLTTPLLLLLQ